MAKYLDENGLLYFWQKIKTLFALKTEVPSAGSTTPAMDGTGATGSSTAYARADHVHPTDTSRAPTSHAVNATTYGAGSSSNYGHVKLSDSTSATTAAASGGTAATPKAVKDALDAAKTYADGVAGDSNQNAFSNIKVGSTTVAADTTTDTLELVAGSNVTLTPDATNDKITIAATNTTYTPASASPLMDGTAAVGSSGKYAREDHVHPSDTSRVPITRQVNGHALSSDVAITASDISSYLGDGFLSDDLDYLDSEIRNKADTKNTAGSTDSSSKLFIVGATSQAANPQTYSHDTAYVGTDGHLYSDSKQVVNLSGSQALTNKTYNGYQLGPACERATAEQSSSIIQNSSALTTANAVYRYVTDAISTAQVGAAMFQGTIAAATTLSNSTTYKKGWYWVVATAGTYAGQTCEVGDMIFCVSDYSSSFKNADFSVVQNNILTIANSDIDTIVAA